MPLQGSLFGFPLGVESDWWWERRKAGVEGILLQSSSIPKFFLKKDSADTVFRTCCVFILLKARNARSYGLTHPMVAEYCQDNARDISVAESLFCPPVPTVDLHSP